MLATSGCTKQHQDVLSVSLCEVYVIHETTDDQWCCLNTLCDVIHGNKYVFIVIVIVIDSG